MLIRLSTPDGLAVTLDDAKTWLSVLHDDEDALLTGQLKFATGLYEDFTGRTMLPTDLEYRTDDFNCPIELPASPVRDVTEVVYLDENDVEQTVSALLWYFERSAKGGRVFFTSEFSAPSLSDRVNPVRVRFSAGYDAPGTSGSGDDPELVPATVDQMNIATLAGRMFDGNPPMDDQEMITRMGMRRVFR